MAFIDNSGNQNIEISDDEFTDVIISKSDVKYVREVGKDIFAELFIHGRLVPLGKFKTSAIAAKAADRAYIRAYGPVGTRARLLNYPLSYYSNDALEKFTVFDNVLMY
jgi:hypothetical protein